MRETLRFWDLSLRDMSHQCRAGAVDPLASVSCQARSVVGRQLMGLFQDGQESGTPLTPTIQALRCELRATSQLVAERVKLLRLMALRFVMMMALVLLIRGTGPFGASPQRGMGPLGIHSPEDIQAIFLGFLLLSVGTTAFLVFLPYPWLWRRELTPLATRWVASHLLGLCDQGDPWASRAMGLEVSACLLGIGMRAEQREILAEWSREQNQKDAMRLKQMEELLPLWEIGVLGLSVVLFLVVPFISGFGASRAY